MQSNRKLSLLRRRLLTLIENLAGKSLLDVSRAGALGPRNGVYASPKMFKTLLPLRAGGTPHHGGSDRQRSRPNTALDPAPDRVGLAREWTSDTASSGKREIGG
ncbi:MAG: hypothetical protein IPN19_07570 [Elusimicrobia bacterium]|nr:hypothetical protein [Elusimicrobiota bacterium]